MSCLTAMPLPTGQAMFKGKNTGLIFYPSLPQRLQGTKESGRPDFDLTWPYDYPQWLANIHSEHATVEVRYPESAQKVVGSLSSARLRQFVAEMRGEDGRKLDREAEKIKADLPDAEYLIWYGGTVHDGIWCGDDRSIWAGGRWRDGIVLGGHFWDCDWITGEKRGGAFHSGVWHGGLHRGGTFEGCWLGGSWLGGEFNGFRERTTVPPGVFSQDTGLMH